VANADRDAYQVLSSDWTGLSRNLIATFYPVRQVEGSEIAWERVPNSIEVRAPITDGTIEQTANWTSPFENQQADAKVSTFSAMLQSGGFDAALKALAAAVPDGAARKAVESLQSSLDGLRGKSAVTKLNSVQIFTGMPPMKISVTAHFRATSNAKTEVQSPLAQLMEWTLPKKLSESGVVTKVLQGGPDGIAKTLYSSEAPQIIAMQFADTLFMPIVIESMGHPLTGPRGSDGLMISAQTTLSILEKGIYPMILFPYLRTRRLAVRLREISLGEAIAVCRLPADRHEATTTEFLRMAARDAEKPTERHIVDPRMMTVQERALLVCHYLSQVSDDGADFTVGADGRLSDYVVFDSDLMVDGVDLGEVAGKTYQAHPLLGVHVEILERLCASRGDWLIGLLACQLTDSQVPDYASMTDPQLLEWCKSRMDAIRAMPESDFEALYLAFSNGSAQLNHFFSISIDGEGVIFNPQDAEAGNKYPARFRAISCVSAATRRLF
jgi:hypothetical protein